MGLFSTLFKSKPKKLAETRLGSFKLIYSENGKNKWSTVKNEPILTVQGSSDAPDNSHLIFLKTWIMK